MYKNCKCASCKPIEYTIKDAMELGENLFYGMSVAPKDKLPINKKQAIEAIKRHQHWMNFNWLTGQHAIEILEKS